MSLTKIPLTSFFLLLTLMSTAQEKINEKFDNQGMYGISGLNAFDLRKQSNISQVFYNNDWILGQLIDAEGEVYSKEFLIRYDILNQNVNVFISNAPFNVPKKNLSGFLLKRTTSENATTQSFIYKSPNDGSSGKTFFEIVKDGKYQLLINHTVKLRKSTYVAALDVGDTKQKVIKKDFFYLKDDNGIYQIPKKKKAGIKFFNSYPKARKYLKNNKVKFKKKTHLVKLFQYMNEEL